MQYGTSYDGMSKPQLIDAGVTSLRQIDPVPNREGDTMWEGRTPEGDEIFFLKTSMGRFLYCDDIEDLEHAFEFYAQ